MVQDLLLPNIEDRIAIWHATILCIRDIIKVLERAGCIEQLIGWDLP